MGMSRESRPALCAGGEECRRMPRGVGPLAAWGGCPSITPPIYSSGSVWIAGFLVRAATDPKRSIAVSRSPADVLGLFSHLLILGLTFPCDGALSQDEDREAATETGYEKEQPTQPGRPFSRCWGILHSALQKGRSQSGELRATTQQPGRRYHPRMVGSVPLPARLPGPRALRARCPYRGSFPG